LAGIRAAKELGAKAITLFSDSQLVVFQIKGDYQAKEPLMQKYLALVKESLVGLSKFEIKHARSEYSRADLLSKFASTMLASAIHSGVEEVIPTLGAVLQIDDEDVRTITLPRECCPLTRRKPSRLFRSRLGMP
jgi:hypothetical protein